MAAGVISWCQELARMSERSQGITRTFLSPPMRDVHNALGGWMGRLGMDFWADAAGNLRGFHSGHDKAAPRLLIGSHVDTVPNAGAYDGVLGVVLGLALIEELRERRFRFGIEVVAFSEEEGVRFRTPFLGSRALVRAVDDALLQTCDQNGCT